MIPSDDAIEQLYAVGVSIGVFDRRKLLPSAQLASAVKAETGRNVSESDLLQFAADGWYTPLPLQGDPSNSGVPLFIPSRIGLLLDLREQGYPTNELRSFAVWEDFWIDHFDELELDYEDDDLQILLRHHRDRLTSAESRLRFTREEPSSREQAQQELEKAKSDVSSLEQLQGRTLKPDFQEKLKRAAFSVRALDESLRLCFVEQDRAKFRAGYSPFVVFRRERFSANGSNSRFEDIDWPATLHVPWIEEWSLGVRLPEFVLDGETMTITRPLIPSTYKRAWVERSLDGYFEALAELNGETRCLHCRSVLPEARKSRQRYCSDACRNAAKQRRQRENNPDAIFKAQSNYYLSLRDAEEGKVEGIERLDDY